MQLVIKPDGQLRCIYCEAIDLSGFGKLEIRRASHVEPDGTGGWVADLSPVGGPTLGSFEHRSSALAAEQDWLETYWLTQAARSD